MERVIIYHMKEIDSQLHSELRYGDRTSPTTREFSEKYEAAETILHTSDPEEAFHRAQGHVVNQDQNARHMVHSAMPTDVFECHSEQDGRETTEYYMVKPIGFERFELNK